MVTVFWNAKWEIYSQFCLVSIFFSRFSEHRIGTVGHKNTICWDKDTDYIISEKVVQLPVLPLCNVLQLRICGWKCYIAFWHFFHRKDKRQLSLTITENFSLKIVLKTSVSGAGRHQNWYKFMLCSDTDFMKPCSVAF